MIRRWLAWVVMVPAIHAASADPPAGPSLPPPPLANATLHPALKAAAERDHVRLFHIDAGGETPLQGDSAVAWVGASDAKGKRQWLIQFRRGTATEAEQNAARKREKTKYLSWGSVVTFKSEAQALDLWIAGPVSITDDAKSPDIAPVTKARVLVPADYLRLGLDNSLRVDQHIRHRFEALHREDPKFNLGSIYALDKPIKPANVAGAKVTADKIPFTPEMERAWIGGYIALEAFYDLANEVPAIEAIALVAVEKPPIWKLAKLATGSQFKTYFGGPQTKAVDPGRIGLVPVATEAFDAPFSFSFGSDLIVSGGMVVSKPIPPFDTTAGILGLLAVHPKDPTRQVHIAIISGVRGLPNSPTP
ncbi:MAG: hypothetical protein ABIZ04_09240 [Opitutus sp.]